MMALAPHRLSSTIELRRLMAAYYQELEQAAQTPERKVAWCSSVGPVELLRSLGFAVYFPENHGAMLGTTRMSTDVIPLATAAGFSPEICSYLTSDVGAHLAGVSPLQVAFGMMPPRPDVLVYNTNQCRDIQEWFSYYHRQLGIPLVGVSTPRGISEVDTTILRASIAQHRALLPTLEEVAIRRLDLDLLKQVVASSYRCSELWSKVLLTAAHNPAPKSFFDDVMHMAPAVLMRGDERAERYYEVLLRELEQRCSEAVAAVDDERFRLYWEGMPIWGRIRAHAHLFAELHACVVASTYCDSWIFEALGDDDPFTGMARASCELFITRDEATKQRRLAAKAAAYQVDGIIFHDAKTCPANSNTRYGLPRRLSDELGIPSLVLNGDLCDLRLFSEEQARTQIEALLEQLYQAPANG